MKSEEEELMNSWLSRINSGIFTDQNSAAHKNGDEDELDEIEEEEDMYNEPLDQNGDPTGKELEPEINPSGSLPSPDPDFSETTLYDEDEAEDGLTSEEI